MSITSIRLSAAAVILGCASMASAGVSENHVLVVIERADDFAQPSASYLVQMDVVIPDTLGVTGVSLAGPGGPIPLEDLGDGEWVSEIGYGGLADVILAYDGAWFVNIEGGVNASLSSFQLNLANVTDVDLIAPPTILQPVADATGVPADTNFQWLPGVPPLPTDLLFIDVSDFNDTLAQEANSLEGSILNTATTWDAPLDVADGMNEVAVGYYRVDNAHAGPIAVFVGTMPWGVSGIPGHLPGMPLVVFGGETITKFEVGIAEPCFDIDDSGVVDFGDLLGVLTAWGPCTECSADFNGDGQVDFTDLLDVLSAWGSSCD